MLSEDEEREKRMAEEKRQREDPTKLLDLADRESAKAWQSTWAKVGRWRRFLCWIGCHDPIDVPGLPTHCRYCFVTLTGEKLSVEE